MFPRLMPAAILAIVTVGLAACSSGPAAVATAPSAARAAVEASPTVGTPAPARTEAPTSSPIASPDSGNVDAPVTPGLSVEPVGTSSIRVTLADQAAKAWRLTVAGTGAHAGDRWSVTVETGDVAPMVTTLETENGVEGQAQEQPRLEMGDATGRVCAASLPVCLPAASLVLPHDGNGTLVLELTRIDGGVSLDVTGSTATWTAEPFVLGNWTTTEAFPWVR